MLAQPASPHSLTEISLMRLPLTAVAALPMRWSIVMYKKVCTRTVELVLVVRVSQRKLAPPIAQRFTQSTARAHLRTQTLNFYSKTARYMLVQNTAAQVPKVVFSGPETELSKLSGCRAFVTGNRKACFWHRLTMGKFLSLSLA